MDKQRYAFVVASQWGVHPNLETLRAEAEELRDLLLDPDRGHCASAYGDGLLFDPGTVTQVRAAVKAAFERANAARSPMVLAFLGHGHVSAQSDFVFPVTTSPVRPDPTTAFAVPARLRTLLADHGAVSGLTVVIDACSAGAAALAAAQDWFPSAMHIGREIEVLASTDGRPAYGLRFSRALNCVIRHGHARLEGLMHSRPLALTLGDTLEDQRPQAVTWSGSRHAAEGGTDGVSGAGIRVPHWVARNVAHNGSLSVVAATPGGGLLPRLKHFQPPPTLPALTKSVLGHRAVALRGPMGSGKTTLVAALSRPELVPMGEDTSEGSPVCALVQLRESWTDESTLAAMARQLVFFLPGFAQARDEFERITPLAERQGLPPARRYVGGPLGLMPTRRPVRVVIDAIDQLDRSARLKVIEQLTLLLDSAPDWFGIVATSRDGVRLPAEWHPESVQAAREEQISGYLNARHISTEQWTPIVSQAAGNWYMAALLADYGPREPGRLVTYELLYRDVLDQARRRAPDGRSTWVDAVVTVLAAAGQGAVLPKPLLAAASAAIEGPDAEDVDHILELLAGLVERAVHPVAGELLGAHHQALVEHVEEAEYHLEVGTGHEALMTALESMAPMDRHDPDDPLHAYATDAEPVHLWHIGSYERLLESLDSRGSTDAAANRDRWAAWGDRLARRPGPEERPTLRAWQKAAYWAGRAGSYLRSREMYEKVLARQLRALPADDPDILESRHRIAYATGEMGDFGTAVDLHATLLADQTRLIGADDRRTLATRHHLAYWTGRGGRMEESLRLHEELLPDQTRVLGPTDRDVLESRHYIAYWYGRLGRYEDALAMHHRLLRDRIEVFGEDHEQIIYSLMNISRFTGEAGRLREVLDQLRALLPRMERQKGPDHPTTLLVRLYTARFTWEYGDAARSLELHRKLVSDQRRVLGDHNHPVVMITRFNIAMLNAELGDAEEALEELGELLARRRARYPADDHPEVLTTRFGIAMLRALTGHLDEATDSLQAVLADRERVLGGGHPEVLLTRSALGDLWGRGQAPGASAGRAEDMLRDTLRLQRAALGDRHPQTMTTRARLASLLIRAGREEEAAEDLRALLPLRVDVLGDKHPDTVSTRETLSMLTAKRG
ncbi:tetratricopeptide repeat protein [Streptomyces sp. NPDC102274]|uniref:tetratricopeptide repeat protein n=1 Tax=Streptomyces sp. NPDC102274 TaxID=3366151 RepID=UPI0037F4D0E1